MHSVARCKEWCFRVWKDPMQGFMFPPKSGAGLHSQVAAPWSLSFLSSLWSVNAFCCKARWQPRWLHSLVPRWSCFPYDVISLVLWARSSAGTNHISSPDFTEAMWTHSCWFHSWGSRQYQTKSPMKALARRRWLPKIQINSCRCKGKSGLWFHCSPLYHCTSALKPDVAINAVKVLATPAQIPFQTQGLANLCRCTWS